MDAAKACQDPTTYQCQEYLASLSSGDVVKIYEWAELDESATPKCSCRHVRTMRMIPGLSMTLGGLCLYRHLNYPCVSAKICGLVVGTTCKDDSITYEVDDGTAVLRIVETRKSLQHSQQAKFQSLSSRLAPSGVPECYIMPPQKKSAEPSHSASLQASSLPPMVPRLGIADIVTCRGRIQTDRDGFRYLSAQSLVRCDDPNSECHHQLDALSLAETGYSQVFPNAAYETWLQASKLPKTPTRMVLRPTLHPKELSRSRSRKHDSVGESASDNQSKEEKVPCRLNQDEARKLLCSEGDPASVPSESRPDRSEHLSTLGSSTQATAKVSPAQEGASRKLRNHNKISDNKLTDSYFRLKVQQWVKEDAERRKDSASRGGSTFCMSDLVAESDLYLLADRIVSLRLQKRSASSASSRSDDRLTTEHRQDKVKRLFEWVIRKMMEDGYIVLADHNKAWSSSNMAEDTVSHPNSKKLRLAKGDEDAYTMVNPKLLQASLSRVVGYSSALHSLGSQSSIVDDLLARLRILDDRFRHVSHEMVHDAWTLMQAAQDREYIIVE